MKTIKLNEADYLSLMHNPIEAVYQQLKAEIGLRSAYLKLQALAEFLKNNEVIKRYTTPALQRKLESLASSNPAVLATITGLMQNLSASSMPYAQAETPEGYVTDSDKITKVQIQTGVAGYTVRVPIAFSGGILSLIRWSYKYYYKIVTYMITNQIPYTLRLSAKVLNDLAVADKLEGGRIYLISLVFTAYSPEIPEEAIPLVLSEFRNFHSEMYKNTIKPIKNSTEQSKYNAFACTTFSQVMTKNLENEIRKLPNRPLTEKISLIDRLQRCQTVSPPSSMSVGLSTGSFGNIFSQSWDHDNWIGLKESLRVSQFSNIEEIDIEDWAQKQSNPWTAFIFFEEPLIVANTLSRRSCFVTTPTIEFVREDSSSASDEEEVG